MYIHVKDNGMRIGIFEGSRTAINAIRISIPRKLVVVTEFSFFPFIFITAREAHIQTEFI